MKNACANCFDWKECVEFGCQKPFTSLDNLPKDSSSEVPAPTVATDNSGEKELCSTCGEERYSGSFKAAVCSNSFHLPIKASPVEEEQEGTFNLDEGMPKSMTPTQVLEWLDKRCGFNSMQRTLVHYILKKLILSKVTKI